MMRAILAVGGVNGRVCKARAPRTEAGPSYALARPGREKWEKQEPAAEALSFSPGRGLFLRINRFCRNLLLSRLLHPSTLSLFFSPLISLLGPAR